VPSPLLQDTILLDLFLVGLGALFGGWICRRLGVPEVLGYLGAGVLLGPTLHPGGFVDAAMIQHITYFAVVFRMFTLGLDFDARRLKGRWGPALSAGVMEMGLCMVAGIGMAALLGWPLLHGAILGGALGTTSTNILSKALADRNMSSREDARAAGAATLAEDLLAMTLIAVLTLYTSSTQGGVFDLAALGENALELAIFATLAFTAGAVLLPLFMDRLSRTHSEELLTLAVVAVLFGFAALSTALGAGRPIGAFLAGIAVGAARQSPGVSARMMPLRDLFAAAAYVGIGLILTPRHILDVAPYALAAVPVFVLLKVTATSIGLRMGGVSPVTSARAGAILGQAGTMGLVVACGPLLGDMDNEAVKDTVGHLIAFAFVAWLVTVALTGVRLRFLPDLAERVARMFGAREQATRVSRLPRASREATRRAVWLALVASACAVALAALAGLGARASDAFLNGPLARGVEAGAGALVGPLVLAFALVAARAFAHATHEGVHRHALDPGRLSKGRREGARPWAVTGSMAGLAVALVAALAMGDAVAPGEARLWLAGGAVLGAAAIALRRAWLARLIERAETILVHRRPPDVRLHDFRGTSPFGYEAEAVLVRAGTRAAWSRVGDLDVKARTGASIVAILRPGTQTPLPFDAATAIPPGAEVVLGGTGAQIVAAKRYLLEPSRLEHDAAPEDGRGDAKSADARARIA